MRWIMLMRAAAALLLSTMLLAGCGSSNTSTAPNNDTIRPAAVTNLTVESTTDSSVTLHWTAVGDDSLTGTASLYDLRFSTREITPQIWDSTLFAGGMHAPRPAGTAESFTVVPLPPETSYYFALRVADERENWSAISNEVTATTGARFYPQSSAAACLRNLRAAYLDRNLQAYAALFTDDFTFVFSPADTSLPQDPTPHEWGLADERSVTDHLFASVQVAGITLHFAQDTAVPAEEFPGTWRVHMNQIRLDVVTMGINGSPRILEVLDGWGTFYFKELLDQQASDGRPLWKIWRWVDQPTPTPGKIDRPDAAQAEIMTWGRLKYRFR